MTNNATWPIELGTTGVLGAGRWLWLRAILWAALLSAGALGFLVRHDGSQRLVESAAELILCNLSGRTAAWVRNIRRHRAFCGGAHACRSASIRRDAHRAADRGHHRLHHAVLHDRGALVSGPLPGDSGATGAGAMRSVVSCSTPISPGCWKSCSSARLCCASWRAHLATDGGLYSPRCYSALRISVMYRGSAALASRPSRAGLPLGCFTW